MSDLVISVGGNSGAVVTAASSSTFSSSSSSSFSASSSSSSSSKVVKQSSSSSKVVSSSSSSKSSNVSIKSSGQSYSDRMAGDLGIDIAKELDSLKLKMGEEFSTTHRDMFSLKPTSPLSIDPPGGIASLGNIDESLVRLDADSIRSCIDKTHGDRLKLNFDVNEYESESISVKTVGNKIEVHAQKKSKKGDEERSEEFSRVYELPTANDVDPTKVTSSIYKDGVLTIELPVSEAMQ